MLKICLVSYFKKLVCSSCPIRQLVLHQNLMITCLKLLKMFSTVCGKKCRSSRPTFVLTTDKNHQSVGFNSDQNNDNKPPQNVIRSFEDDG